SAAELRARNDVHDQPDEVVTLDPRHPLLTAADRTAETELERRKQIAEHPGLSAKHETDAQPDDAHSELFSFPRRAFPGVANAVSDSSPHVPYHPIDEPLIITAGRRCRRAIRWTTSRVMRSREARIRRRLVRVHRPLATGSPAKLTTVSITASLAI